MPQDRDNPEKNAPSDRTEQDRRANERPGQDQQRNPSDDNQRGEQDQDQGQPR